MRRRVVSRPRVDEKGGKNQFPRSGQLAAIHLPSHDLEISGISKERRICVQKTDGFTPLRPSLAFNPLFHQSPLFFSFFFFLHWIASSTLLFVFFPLFFPSSSFFFFFSSFAEKTTPSFLKNSVNMQDMHHPRPPLISSLRRPRCEMIFRNQEKIYLPTPSFCSRLSFPVSLSLSFSLFCAV